jgi:hypothetical protein
MAGQFTRNTYPLAEHARIRGGTLTARHEHNCLSRQTRDEADCRCQVVYRLQRAKTERRAR